MAGTAAGIAGIWLAVVLISVLAPDMVTGSEQQHLPVAAFATWLWGLIATAVLVVAVGRLRGRLTHRPVWTGLAVATVVVWAVATVLALAGPRFETGTDPTRIPLAALIAPVAATVLTALGGVAAGVVARSLAAPGNQAGPSNPPRPAVRRRGRAGAAGLAAVALVAVGALVACGDDAGDGGNADNADGGADVDGDGDGGTPAAFDVQAVKALPEQAADAGTFSFEMTVAYVLGVDRNIEYTYRGAVDVGAHQATLEADITSLVTDFLMPPGGSDAPDEVIVPMVVDGDVAYAELVGVLNDIAPPEERRTSLPRWVRMGPSDLEGPSSAFTGVVSAADPEGILALLESATGEVETVGREDVRGEPATHYRATLDLEAATQQAPDGRWALLDDLAGEDGQITEVPVDIWVGDDGQLRRLAVETTPALTGTTAGDGASPLSSIGTIRSLTYDAYDYGDPVRVEIPDPDDTIDASELDMLDPPPGS
ncbi:MAG TPA: hypothetical protein VIL48_17480 [Acidimicrobiales bacterium]